MTVHLSGPPAPWAHGAERLGKQARALLGALDAAESELSVALVDSADMAAANWRWRGRRGPTDVLAFSLLEGDHARHRGALLGDVVIAVDIAERQAREAGHSLGEELLRLLIHGVLHLFGYDHAAPAEARIMQQRERELFEAVGP